MPLQATSGAASYDAFGGGVFVPPVVPNYIEEVFSTWLYTGTGATQTITNGIDLSTKGGLVWIKSRSAATNNNLFNTAQGTTKSLHSNTTDATTTDANSLTAFNTTGFTLGSGNTAGNQVNTSAATYASWTFRKQPKFFDIQTVTTNGSGAATFSHNLGSTPGCIFFKSTASNEAWYVWHRSLGNSQFLVLNSTVASAAFSNWCVPSSTSISLSGFTANQAQIVYIFAHDAGGFGLTGTDNVISCGTFTVPVGGIASVNLGYEPQWVLVKGSSAITNWQVLDNMRGFVVGAASASSKYLNANSSAAELDTPPYGLTNTGFNYSGAPSTTFIYIAIRRGPMKVPTVGTTVFGLNARSGTGANATVTGGQTDDAVLIKNRGSAVGDLFSSRLLGVGYQETSSTAAEVQAGTTILQANPWDVMDGVKVGTTSTITNASANTFINYLFKRAPSFFDVVCYTGNSTAANTPQTITHNLGVTPELIILRGRTTTDATWLVGYNFTASQFDNGFLLNTNATNPIGYNIAFFGARPTVTTFSVTNQIASNPFGNNSNYSGNNYVAYLFATCAGVSKVGSYTGNGTTQTIDCGFDAGGARFVLIKRINSTSDWYVYDTARGMTVLTDPYWLTNTTAAEVATLGSVTTVATGFALNSAILAAINVNAGTYIFLAIA